MTDKAHPAGKQIANCPAGLDGLTLQQRIDNIGHREKVLDGAET